MLIRTYFSEISPLNFPQRQANANSVSESSRLSNLTKKKLVITSICRVQRQFPRESAVIAKGVLILSDLIKRTGEHRIPELSVGLPE